MMNYTSGIWGKKREAVGKFVADEGEIKRLTENVKKVAPKLDADEVVAGREILNSFECLICKTVPIAPVQCEKCDALFCNECVEDNRMKTSYRNRDRCPYCKQLADINKLNNTLKKLTIDKLTFKHQCIKESQDERPLTAFEKFKLTPQYKEL